MPNPLRLAVLGTVPQPRLERGNEPESEEGQEEAQSHVAAGAWLSAAVLTLQVNGHGHGLGDDVEHRRVLLSSTAQLFQRLIRHVCLDSNGHLNILEAVSNAFGEPQEAVEVEVSFQAGLHFVELDPVHSRVVDE